MSNGVHFRLVMLLQPEIRLQVKERIMRAPYKVNFNELPWEAPSLGIRVKTDENTSVF